MRVMRGRISAKIWRTCAGYLTKTVLFFLFCWYILQHVFEYIHKNRLNDCYQN